MAESTACTIAQTLLKPAQLIYKYLEATDISAEMFHVEHPFFSQEKIPANPNTIAGVSWFLNLTDPNAFTIAQAMHKPTQLINKSTEMIDISAKVSHVKHPCPFHRKIFLLICPQAPGFLGAYIWKNLMFHQSTVLCTNRLSSFTDISRQPISVWICFTWNICFYLPELCRCDSADNCKNNLFP